MQPVSLVTHLSPTLMDTAGTPGEGNDMQTNEAPPEPDLSYRALAMLRAVGSGRAQLTCSSEPDLFIDGLPCCDQFAAHHLTHAGLIQPTQPGRLGQRVAAGLTAAGRLVVERRSTAA